jgi:signal transduction histidine kinase
LATAENVSQEVAGEIRNYCDELSPSWVKLGLRSAMYENADRMASIYGVEIEVDMEIRETWDNVSEEQVLALIRILQEAVSNSVRHGKSRSIRVTLKEKEGELFFVIRDDGGGFHIEKVLDPAEADADYENLRTTGHRGLANMHERVQLLRGAMRVDSEPGRGCLIDIRFPLKTATA